MKVAIGVAGEDRGGVWGKEQVRFGVMRGWEVDPRCDGSFQFPGIPHCRGVSRPQNRYVVRKVTYA